VGERKRIEEGYKKVINEVQEKFQAHGEEHAAKVKELEHQYTEKVKQMRLTLKYKDKY